MNKEDIIAMAIKSHLVMYDYDHPSLEAFAKLIAEKEREEVTKERKKSEHLLWLFQEWKEDHLSQYNYIEAVEAIRARSKHEN